MHLRPRSPLAPASPRPAPASPRPAPASPRATIARLAIAVVAGLVLHLAFPAPGWWWCAPLAVMLWSVAVRGARTTVGGLAGLLLGVAFFVPTLSWSGVYVGALPWLALAGAEALYFAAMGAVTAAVQTPLLRRGWSTAAYAVVPVAWVVQESARSLTPFGGFPWARLAFSQADSPLSHYAAYVGAPGVGLAVALTGVGLHALLRGAVPPHRLRSAALGGAVAALLPLGSAAIALPTDGTPERVAIVQGNVPEAGLDFNAQRRKVLDNHVQETVQLLRHETVYPSVIIWPENSSDIDPLRNADAGQEIRAVTQAAGVPILVGAVLDEPAPRISNVSLLYRPGAAGPPERYVKQHPVPFAEYIPYRSFFRLFSDKVDLVRADFAAGDQPGAFRISGGHGSFWLAPVICFEVAYDGLVRDALTQQGKQDNILVVQTNNATFGYTDESEQQFAISRLRAIEHGRSVAHVSTVGVSALIRPDGSFARKTKLFTADEMVGTLPVRSQVTVSDRIGALPEGLCLLALVVLALAGRLPRRPARVDQPRTAPDDREPLGV